MRLVDFDSTGCVLAVLGRWPPQGHQTPQAGAQHCGPLWRLKLVIPLARRPLRLEGTPMGVYPKSWRQVMLPEMPVTALDISTLHGFLC